MEAEIPDTLSNNPFVPPKGDACYINQLPNELLSHIFCVGVWAYEDEDDEEDDEEDAPNLGLFYDEDTLGGANNTFGEQAMNLVPTPSAHSTLPSIIPWVPPAESPSPSSSFSSPHDELQLPFQVLVSHVCKHWRSIALSLPSIWTTISVPVFAQPPFTRVQAYIERSNPLPLNISIDCEVPDSEDDESESSPHSSDSSSSDEKEVFISESDLRTLLLQILIPELSRWRSFELTVSSYHYMYCFLELLSSSTYPGTPSCPFLPPATSLETLQLYCYSTLKNTAEEYVHFSPVECGTKFILFNDDVPKLSNVALWGVHLEWTQGFLCNRANLRDLELAYHADDVRPTWQEFVNILRCSPRLETLTLSCSGPAGGVMDWRVPIASPDSSAGNGPSSESDAHLNEQIELPSLKNLVLAYHEPEYVGPLMRRLVLPGLTSLALDLEGSDFSAFGMQLVGPAPTLSSPNGTARGRSILAGLNNLKVSGLPIADRVIHAILDQLVELKYLNVNFYCLPQAWYRALLEQDQSKQSPKKAIRLPNLETITTTGLDGSMAMTLVRARQEQGVPLTSLYMNERDEVSTDQVKWLQENLTNFDFFEGSEDEYDEFDVDEEDLSDDMDDFDPEDLEDFDEDEEDEWDDI